MEYLVKDFLKEVKEKLPGWIRDNKAERKGVLSELEEHVWDKAEELSETGKPTEQSVRLAISYMGSPSSIAREYKKRGTPKYYITEELWPVYTKVLGIVCGILIVLNIVLFVLNLVTAGLIGDLSFSFTSIFIAFTIITVIFVALSMEGYFPEDFASPSEVRKKEKEMAKGAALGLPVSSKTGEQLKPFIKPTGKIAEGIVGIVFSMIFFMAPIIISNVIAELTLRGVTASINTEIYLYIRIWAIIGIVEGGINLSRGIIGNQQPAIHQGVLGVIMATKIANAITMAFVALRPEIIPWIAWFPDTGVLIIGTITPEFYGLVQGILLLIAIIVFLTLIEDVYWIAKLERYKL